MTEQKYITGEHLVAAINANAFPQEILDGLPNTLPQTVNVNLHHAAVDVVRGHPPLRDETGKPVKSTMQVIALVRPLVTAALETRNSENI